MRVIREEPKEGNCEKVREGERTAKRKRTERERESKKHGIGRRDYGTVYVCVRERGGGDKEEEAEGNEGR